MVLASASPRRRQLLSDLGFEFTVEVRPTAENFADTLAAEDVPAFLAKQKAAEFVHDIGNRLILCADTIVEIDGQILNKPANAAEAKAMIQKLSGQPHRVITGFCLASAEGVFDHTDIATVYFKQLSDSEIDYYIEHYKPFDKAGAYGIQEWIGMMGIERIEGSFYTIMGLPVHQVYEALKQYI